jgi:hypothetical protein
MEMTMEREYVANDLYFSAACRASGVEPLGREFEERHMQVIFDNNPEFQKLRNAYYSNGLLLNPRRYAWYVRDEFKRLREANRAADQLEDPEPLVEPIA